MAQGEKLTSPDAKRRMHLVLSAGGNAFGYSASLLIFKNRHDNKILNTASQISEGA